MKIARRSLGHAASVTASLAVALALLVSSASDVHAVAGAASLSSATLPAGGEQLVTIADTDIAAGAYVVLSISSSSAGTAQFTGSGGASLVVFNGESGDVDAAVNGAIVVSVTGTGGPGAVIVNGNLFDGADGIDGAGADGDAFTVAWEQTSPSAALSLFVTVANIPATPDAAIANTQAVLSALVTTSTGTNVPAGTLVSFQSVGPGRFTDSIAAPAVVAGAVGGGAYDGGAASNSGCAQGEGLQSCNATTGTVDDGEAGSAEPTTGVASVTFEGAGTAGTAQITARAGALSATITVTLHDLAASVTAEHADYQFIPDDGASTANITVTVLDPAGIPVSNDVPIFSVTEPTLAGQQVGLAGAPNGDVPSCAAGTDANGQCNVLVTASTTQGVNVISVMDGTETGEATIEITLVGAAATVEIDGSVPSRVQHLSTTPITVNVLDAEGDPAPDDTVCMIAVTGTGVITDPAPLTFAGECVSTLVTGSVDGTIQLVVTVGGLAPIQKTITVSGVASPEDGSGDTPFAGGIAERGVSFVVFAGGPVSDLAEAAMAEGLISVSVTVNGRFVGYVVGAPQFVNAAFAQRFVDGIPAGPVAVKR